jgi:hypothetical protein
MHSGRKLLPQKQHDFEPHSYLRQLIPAPVPPASEA